MQAGGRFPDPTVCPGQPLPLVSASPGSAAPASGVFPHCHRSGCRGREAETDSAVAGVKCTSVLSQPEPSGGDLELCVPGASRPSSDQVSLTSKEPVSPQVTYSGRLRGSHTPQAPAGLQWGGRRPVCSDPCGRGGHANQPL